MKDGRILSKCETVAAVAVSTDEYIAREGGYTFDDVAGNVHEAALIDFDSTVEGVVKVTLAGKEKTVGTYPFQNLIDRNVHVVKVWETGTDESVDEDTMFLWL